MELVKTTIERKTLVIEEVTVTQEVIPCKYGAYSAQADKDYGSCIWKDINGNNVRVTCVCDDVQWIADNYKWPDTKIVALVTKFVLRDRDGMWGKWKWSI